ncbi:MAG: MBOAT family protein, partial [Verrucomicrobia bacterium]|nr:MBOAT family protein [Verrucomicrobiota bacterium]
MVFNSDIFLFVFLPVLFTLFWLSKTKQQRYVLLTLSGYVFYGYWNWRYCGLLLFSSVVSYSAGLLVEGSASSRWKRFWVVLSVSVDLTLLGFFKYYNFFVANITCVFPHAPLPLISVVLPVGISFYTFHTISYIVDVAAGRV